MPSATGRYAEFRSLWTSEPLRSGLVLLTEQDAPQQELLGEHLQLHQLHFVLAPLPEDWWHT
jgi:hypothetical protein